LLVPGAVKRWSFLTAIMIASLGAARQPPVLNAASLYDLHDSADYVKSSLQLSREEFASLEHALDVLVGDDARRLMERVEKSRRPVPAAVRLAAEARVLAPIDGMTYPGLVTAAVEKTTDRRTGLLGDLRTEKAAAVRSRSELQKIEVVRAVYWSSVATGERAVDFVIDNGSGQPLSGLLLDCRLIDTVRRQRERGTCRVEFQGGLASGLTAAASAPVGWESRQRLGWVVEARPIRAYGPTGDALWEVASEDDPREAGRVAELEGRIADLDHDLQSLQVEPFAGDP
jgi:hypothetical protein